MVLGIKPGSPACKALTQLIELSLWSIGTILFLVYALFLFGGNILSGAQAYSELCV